MLGVAHFDHGDIEVAAREFKRLVDRPSRGPNPLKPLAHRYYGRTLARTRNNSDSRKAYDEFFAIWTDADANLPVRRAARAEYTRLRPKDP